MELFNVDARYKSLGIAGLGNDKNFFAYHVIVAGKAAMTLQKNLAACPSYTNVLCGRMTNLGAACLRSKEKENNFKKINEKDKIAIIKINTN